MFELHSPHHRQPRTSQGGLSHRLAFPLLALLLWLLPTASAATDLSNYAVQPGYSLEVDSSGFLLPTSIAVVPEPGPAPDAPLYFVAELHGSIRVVTRDRSVHLFARVEADRGQSIDLSGESQSGLAGICLDPARGYVFVTYTEADAGGVLRNRIVRYSTEPERFALQPSASRDMGEVLGSFQSAPAHQIGNCIVEGERLFVGVGDGGNPGAAQDPAVLLGKVLCFDVEGGPCRDNPFAGGDPRGGAGPDATAGSGSGSSDGGAGPAAPSEAPPAASGGGAGPDATAGARPQEFVYAWGFRNPFGLQLVNGDLYSAENGVEVDRLVRVERGTDHLWRGTDQSFATAAELVFTSVISPVQLDYISPRSEVVDESRRGLFVAGAYGGDDTNSGLVLFGPAESDRGPIPEYLVEYVGEQGEQHLGAVAVGEEAIFFAPMVPGVEGTSDVLALRFEPTAAHTVLIAPRAGLEAGGHLGPLAERGCVSCHSVAGQGGGIGPTLDEFAIKWRLTRRLDSAEYEVQLRDLIEAGSGTDEWHQARQEVLQAEGIDRTWVWLGYYLQEPGFDGTPVAMPDLGLGEEEARELRARLFEVLGIRVERPTLVERAVGFLGRNREPLLLGGAAGAFGTLLLFALTIPLGLARPRAARVPERGQGRRRGGSRVTGRSHG